MSMASATNITVAPNTNNGGSVNNYVNSVPTSQTSPLKIANDFILQYYSVRVYYPDSLYRFYREDSILSMSTNSGDTPVVGKGAIKEHFAKLNYVNCHTHVLAHTAHLVTPTCVVLLISGELSNNGEMLRRYCEVFTLIRCDADCFYVKSHMFHFQDEACGDNSSDLTNSPPEAAASHSNCAEEVVNSSSSLKAVTTITTPAVDAFVVEGNHLPESELNDGGSHVVVVEPQQQQHTTTSATNGTTEHYDEDVVASKETLPESQVEVLLPASDAAGGKEKEEARVVHHYEKNHVTPAVVSAVKRDAEVKVKPTWANIANAASAQPMTNRRGPSVAPAAAPSAAATVVSNGVAHKPVQSVVTAQPKAKAASNGTAVVAATAQPQEPVEAGSNSVGEEALDNVTNKSGNEFGNRRSGGGRNNRFHGPNGVANRPPPKSNAMSNNAFNAIAANYPDAQQLFVGNLPHLCTEEELQAFFGKFGPVVLLRINPSVQRGGANGRAQLPNYGFVIMESAEDVQKILSQRPLFLREGQRLNVEEKHSSFSSNGRRGNNPGAGAPAAVASSGGGGLPASGGAGAGRYSNNNRQ